MTITTIISTIIASLANLPMTLESGLSFPIGNWSPSEATRILMENSPFYISMTSNGGIQLTNSKGQWITRTSPIVEAKSFDNGYCYFVTESGHKYQFTIIDFDEQFAQMEMDMAWDRYLKECEIDGIAPMSFAQWKTTYIA